MARDAKGTTNVDGVAQHSWPALAAGALTAGVLAKLVIGLSKLALARAKQI